MMKYLIILLAGDGTSFCHYKPSFKRPKSLITLETLKKGIRFGMMENLNIQFVYPERELPQEYKEVIETIDHSKIMPVSQAIDTDHLDELGLNKANVAVVNDWKIPVERTDIPLVVRTCKEDLFNHYRELYPLLATCPRINVVFTDVETFTENDFETYKEVLGELSNELESLYMNGLSPQLNILTDRMMLSEMNNCGAGDTTLTLAPNGRFYICPAFYYEDVEDSVGSLEGEPDIKNRQLYKLEYAPICRHCDAYQCKRCVWLNRKLTLEVNTPSRQQCIMAHIERNASRELLLNIRKHGTFMPKKEICEISYLDPYDDRNNWTNH